MSIKKNTSREKQESQTSILDILLARLTIKKGRLKNFKNKNFTSITDFKIIMKDIINNFMLSL